MPDAVDRLVAVVFEERAVFEPPGATGTPHDGVREALAALHVAGYRLAVVTARPETAAEAAGAFEAVVSAATEAEDGWPLRALATLTAAPGEVLFVGATEAALQAARAAGLHVAAAAWAGGDAAALAWLRPDWSFERPADLTRALARWC